MKLTWLGLALIGIALTGSGCATVGPPVLSSCLADDSIMAAYERFYRENHQEFLRGGRAYLVGGFHRPTNTVNCYWDTNSLKQEVLWSGTKSPTFACIAAGNSNCTVLMDGPQIVFRPSTTASLQSSVKGAVPEGAAPPQRRPDVVFNLIGAFAEGLARGFAEQSAQRANTTQSAMDERPLTCTPDVMPGPTGVGYTCRRRGSF